jgi:hypothetical protein
MLRRLGDVHAARGGKTYATALLETLDFLSDPPPAVLLLASGVGRVVDLKRRLTMIMRGTTPRTLGWRGGAAVVGLGALLLPMLPAWVQAQPKPETKTETVTTAAPGGDDKDNVRAQLKQAEATLAQKQAEEKAAAALVELLRAHLGQVPQEAAKRVYKVEFIDTDQNGVQTPFPQVRVAQGSEMPAAQEALMRLLEVQPDLAGNRGLIVVREDDGKIVFRVKIPDPQAGAAPAVPAAKRNGGDADKRIDELEQKLKRIVDEVEKLGVTAHALLRN